MYYVTIEPKIRDKHHGNRFEKQFNQADSVFMSKLREASNQAVRDTNKQLKLK